MSNIKKVFTVYILFGLAISALVTASGGYTALVIEGALGYMSAGTYTGLMALLTIGWLPALVSITLSSSNYLGFRAGKALPVQIMFVFTLCCRFFTKRK